EAPAARADRAYRVAEACELRVARLSERVAPPDLLDDHHEAEQPEDLVEREAVDRKPAAARIERDNFRARGQAGASARGTRVRRRPAPSRRARRRGPSADRRAWPFPSRARRRSRA